MKNRTFFIFVLLLISMPFLPIGFAQDYTQIGLPEGAITRFGKGYINDIAYSPDGSRLGIATSIGMWLYDTSTDTPLNLLSEVPRSVQAIAFSPDGKTLASGGYLPNHAIRLWDTDTGELRGTLDGYEDILSLTFSPDGTLLASSGGPPEYRIRLWSVATHQLRDTYFNQEGSAYAIAFSPDGETLVSGGGDNRVRLWDVRTGELKCLLEGHGDDVNSVVFSPDGKTLASGSRDGTIHLWDVRIGRRLAVLRGSARFPEEVEAIAFSPDGTTLASATADQVWLWDISTRQIKKILEGHVTPVTKVAFSPDGKTIASVSWDYTLRLWDASTGKLRKIFGKHTNSVNTVAFSPDGKTIASASRGLIYLWNTKGCLLRLWYARTGEHINFIDHIDVVRTVVFSPDGKLLASGGYDSRLRLWEADTGHHIVTLRGGGPAVAFSPDGKLIASEYGGDGTIGTMGLWDVQTGELHHVLGRHYSPLTCMAFSPDGKILATANRDSEIVLWDIYTAQRRLSLTTHHTEGVYSMAFSPDGKTLVSSSSDQTLRFWDPYTGEHKVALQYPDAITSIAFSPDGRILAVGWGEWANNRIQLLDLKTLQPLNTLVGHTEDITDLSFSPDGRTLASASYDGTMLLWKTGIAGGLADIPEDVNSDGSVNIEDLTFVADYLGQVGEGNAADVNGDGVVNVLDLVAVADTIKGNLLLK